MLRDDIQRGVAATREESGFSQDEVERVAGAISREALTDAHGREALALSRDGDQVVHYNLVNAITAAAGALGAVLSITVPLTLPPVLAAIGALGALHGLRQPLPRASAQIANLLFVQEDKTLSRQALLESFKERYDGPPEEMDRDFENGLKALNRVKSIREELGIVCLVELIVLRV